MDDEIHEIHLISDGDGLAVIGRATDVEAFLVAEGLPSTDLGAQRLRAVAGAGAAAAQAGSEMAAASGRWVKLTPNSAASIKKLGLRQSSKSGLSTGVLKGDRGRIAGFVEFEGAGSLLGNPAALTGVATIMAQLAMQQAMEEVTDYLATINEKVDDILRAQKDAALARMIGVGLVLKEALTIRESRGGVDEVTWSQVQGAPSTIAETQAYALRQLDALAEKMEGKSRIADLAAAAKEAETVVREWLAVLARCFQLQDAVAVLELDRVSEVSPEELDGHRLGLKKARQERLDLIVRSTERLMARMNAVAGTANAKVLLHPAKSPTVVQLSNDVSTGVHEFHRRLGIESGGASSETRRWVEAATEARDKALETGAKGVDAARSLGTETLDRATSVKDKLSSGIADRARRLLGDGNSDATSDGDSDGTRAGSAEQPPAGN